jgi:hemerythrin-like metal-binding protein
MREYAYPAYLDHLKEHEDFTQKVIDFQKDFLAGKALVSISILKFLYDWLLFHIQGSDAKYSAFFNQKGLR